MLVEDRESPKSSTRESPKSSTSFPTKATFHAPEGSPKRQAKGDHPVQDTATMTSIRMNRRQYRLNVSSNCMFSALYYCVAIFIPCHRMVEYYGFTLDVHVSVRPSVFRFRMITWVNINGFSPDLVSALILWRSGLGLLIGKFLQFLTKLSAHYMSIFLFPHDNLSKFEWIFTKLGMCIDIVEIWIEIANGQILSILTELSASHKSISLFPSDNLSKY